MHAYMHAQICTYIPIYIYMYGWFSYVRICTSKAGPRHDEADAPRDRVAPSPHSGVQDGGG